MKGKSNFGYKILLVVSLLIVIANAGARDFKSPFDIDDPADDPDSTSKQTDTMQLKFPIYDNSGNPLDRNPSSIDLKDPSNIDESVEYSPDDSGFYFKRTMSDRYLTTPSFMDYDDYVKYRQQKDEQDYWKRRLDALTLFNNKPKLPTMYKEGLFDRIFGGNKISVKPQGNVDVTFGGNWQNIQNPTLPQNAQKYGVFDFDMQMNINLLATVGDKLKLNISNNTNATFDYQNIQKLEYVGKEDEIIKKIEAGNVSFPLNSSLINGVQSLFGLKTQLQFGKLWVTAVVSQQRSKRNSLTIQGGSQTQQFAIKADDYEENRHFLLAQYFRDNYDNALSTYPVISSLVTINKIEVWVTNRTGATEGVRNVIGFMDLGERNPYQTHLNGSVRNVPYSLPDNYSNQLYAQLQQSSSTRVQGTATSVIQSMGLSIGRDFEPTTARRLKTTEYTFNERLGYISLNTQINPDDVLAVAFRYTYNGRTYQVGEFAEDLPPERGQNVTPNPNPNNPNLPTTNANQRVMFLKLLKGTSARPQLPVWDLMMKNIYALGGLGVSKEDFRLNVLYQDPGGGEKRYLPEGVQAGVPLIRILNLDRLNYQNDPAPDGIFDFVEGITISTQQGKIIFPVLEPFGEGLKPALGDNAPQLERKYLYRILYDSTKTVARQFQQNNRYVLKGSFKSSSSSEIFLGGFNIPQGSVSVTAGGQKLVENVDYQIDYGLGRLKILNTGILNSGIPINVQYEDNATFGFQQQNFMGTRLDYFVNDKLTIGGTFMRLTERPFTQKTNVGEDPIKNTVIGLDANYQAETPGVTRALDKVPIFSTSAPSFLNVTGEVAGLLPSHPRQIDVLDPEGSVYIDDFEGTRSSYDLKFPANSWTLSSTPVGATDANGTVLFNEADKNDDLDYGKNRARLAWYFLEPTLVDPGNGIPGYIKDDQAQHYIRLVQQQEVFPQRSQQTLQNALSTLDLAYYPKDRGPYNFDVDGVTTDGKLVNPERRWAGIQRPIDNSDFEQSNVEFIEFWMMDPFINRPNSQGGELYLNLGNVSEDVLKDSRQFFENGIPYPKNASQLVKTNWGYTPTFQQQITRAFDNDPAARSTQDVGYDGLDNAEEQQFFANYLNNIASKVTNTAVLDEIRKDPANDDYKYFRDGDYESASAGVLTRYKKFNNPHGNSPVADGNSSYSFAGTNIPEAEDINRDNTLNQSEDYYQYRMKITPNMDVGTNYIINKQESNVKLPNGASETETWYQFKIPIRDYSSRVGNISDFRSIRFIRMFMTGFQDSVVMRFARLELGRNNWRRYLFSLQDPGENIPENDRTEFSVLSVSLEENSERDPIPYVIPPGVNRQQANVANGQSIQLNEQALSLQVCNLKDGDARAVFKEVNADMRQFDGMRMFIHAESRVGQNPIKDGDVRAIIRIGSDFINNYYEYQVPLKTSPFGSSNEGDVWPEANRIDLKLQDLVAVKTERNGKGLPTYVPYESQTENGNTIVVVGNPNIGDAKTMMLGIYNPKKHSSNPLDDGMEKCAEVWFNELRLIGLNEKPGYAAAGKISLQMADLGNVNLSGSMHTQGYGNIDQKLNQRYRDNFYQYNASTLLNMGKVLPRKWGVQLPVFVGYSENISNPQYDPYDLDVTYKDKLNSASDTRQKDSLRKTAQDYTSVLSFNFSNVRILGNPDKQNPKIKPWSVKNFDFSYAYNKQFKRNPIIESDKLIDQKFGLGYTYTIRSKSIEPFKNLFGKSKSPWLGLIKGFNFKPLPANFTFRTDLNRIFNETLVRNITNDPIKIDPTYFKNFLWTRTYSTRWELTRSLSFDYNATNNSRIDEPYGRIDNKQKQDSLWNAIGKFGRNTFYTQSFNASYNLPLQKIPLTDWTNVRLNYGNTYSWTAASRLAQSQGNTIGNTKTTQVNGELNFTRLYNKQRWLRAVNQPKPPKTKDKEDPTGDSTGTKGGKNVKDLRDSKKNDTKKASSKDDFEPFDIDKAIEELAGKMTDQQLDSTRKVFEEREAARIKAAKEKARIKRREERQKKRNSMPEVNDLERFSGRLLTMVKRTTVNVTENSGTTLPGWMDSTRFLGMNNRTGAPGFNFIYGYQPNRSWLEKQSSQNRLSRDSLFNAQFQQQYSQNLNIVTTVEPIKDLRFDFTVTQTFSKALNELFKDTTFSSDGDFTHNNIYETGSFTVSYIGLSTLFKRGGANSSTYNQLLKNRTIISARLGENNPYVKGTKDPNNPDYVKGYTEFSQDVLVPSFIAAYSGKDAKNVGLIRYDNSSIRNNPFREYRPMPNWRMRYNGLTKVPAIRSFAQTLVINHAYTGTLSMNSFVSALYYQDVYGLGFPSFIDSNSGNFVPFFQVPNITISEQLNPLIGFDASFTNNMTASFEYRKTRNVSLSLIDYQVSETNSTEYIVGAGYRIKGLVLPFEIFGLKKLKNNLNIKVDVSIRDDRTSNSYLAQSLEVVTRGQKVITISPSADYIVSDKLTLRFFYDRRRSIPYITSSYPITTTKAGVTLRFIFAQ
ncbi:MAG: cell surface protein SprA [Chitinophagales bacterium]|nr:cell surface protein SprA [Chitinophagaceae bacterium]MCB9065496.1 cell surface protein SprA [Chitinophagales bacterium]